MSASASQPSGGPARTTVQRLLRDKKSGLYYRRGNWVADRDLAQNFATWTEPRGIARTFPSRDLEIVVKSLENDEATIPLTLLIHLGASIKDEGPPT